MLNIHHMKDVLFYFRYFLLKRELQAKERALNVVAILTSIVVNMTFSSRYASCN